MMLTSNLENKKLATQTSALSVRVWGARGSVPTPTRANAGVGGNTPCVQMTLPSGRSLIFDAGTGIRAHGLDMAPQHPGQHIDLLLSHFHWDHLQGLPFFAPMYIPGNHMHFISGCPTQELERVLRGQMTAPYFPVPYDVSLSTKSYTQIEDEPMNFDGTHVSRLVLHHPGGSFGYRVDAPGASVVYATDHEVGEAEADQRLLNAAKGADVLLFDAQFTLDEAPKRRGWGHSTWQDATRFAREADVKKLLLFHHDPSHSDDQLQQILELAQAEFANTELATEDTRIEL